jgi:hypothetical protein
VVDIVGSNVGGLRTGGDKAVANIMPVAGDDRVCSDVNRSSGLQGNNPRRNHISTLCPMCSTLLSQEAAVGWSSGLASGP